MSLPDVCYTAIGPDRVAYQTLGEGPRELLYTWGSYGNLDAIWDDPLTAKFLRRLGGIAKVIRFDRRGSGLSDPRPNDGHSVCDHFCQDLLQVLDATGAKAPVLFGSIDAGPLLLNFVARHPERCSGLIFAITTACVRHADDYPQGHDDALIARFRNLIVQSWGRDEFTSIFVPSQAKNPEVLRLSAKLQRAMASPRTVAENFEQICRMDARALLPTLQVPVLAIGRAQQRIFTAAQTRYIAEQAPQGRYLELSGGDGNVAHEGAEQALVAIEEFVTGSRGSQAVERSLATLLFTDIVDSTKLATKLGDTEWRAKLDLHDRYILAGINLHGGRLIDTAGDGSFALFTSPSAAIECAHHLHGSVAALKLKLRAGLHIGEVEHRSDGRIGGMAVHIAARVLGEATTSEVWVSRTVRDVLLGSKYQFSERGIHELKGVPSKWPLYAVGAP